jgi:hypothetical protein
MIVVFKPSHSLSSEHGASGIPVDVGHPEVTVAKRLHRAPLWELWQSWARLIFSVPLCLLA